MIAADQLQRAHAGVAEVDAIGLGGTEIHPMAGRCFRRPFGADYFTITDNGLLTDWREQLHFFDKIAQTPTFTSIYKALRSTVENEWDRHQIAKDFRAYRIGLKEKRSHLLPFLSYGLPDLT
jgi:hypothetical protein